MDGICDFVLVGDSVGMVLHGLTSTLEVTMDMMILHGQAVRRGLKQSMLVIDMPFGSYEQSPQQAFASAARLMRETGAGAVKLEGGEVMAETIAFLTRRGIPVMAHIGPTIGIGASAKCDGQILVVDDMLGLFTAFKAKFVKRYATLGEGAKLAVQAYADEVQTRVFPGPEHVFSDESPKK